MLRGHHSITRGREWIFFEMNIFRLNLHAVNQYLSTVYLQFIYIQFFRAAHSPARLDIETKFLISNY